jgi:hypothetical protein
MMLVILVTIAGACSGSQATPPDPSPSAGELTGVRVEVHEAPD